MTLPRTRSPRTPTRVVDSPALLHCCTCGLLFPGVELDHHVVTVHGTGQVCTDVHHAPRHGNPPSPERRNRWGGGCGWTWEDCGRRVCALIPRHPGPHATMDRSHFCGWVRP